jgi:hypothetical protein
MKEPSIIFKSAAEGADQIGGAAPKPPVWGEQQTNLNAIVFSKSHPIHHSYSDLFLLNLTHTTKIAALLRMPSGNSGGLDDSANQDPTRTNPEGLKAICHK